MRLAASPIILNRTSGSADHFRRFPPRTAQDFAAMDQPTNDGVNTFFVSQAARQAGLTVVLSGLGGDEVFWGYGHYRTVQKMWRWVDACLGRPSFRDPSCNDGRQIPGGEGWMRSAYLNDMARSKAQNGSTASQGMYLSLRGFFPPSQVARLLGISESAVAETAEQVVGGPVPAGPNGFNYLEFKRYMHDQLLRDSDVFSMAHSIELRVPLLDHKIVEYAARLTPGSKLRGAANKPVLVGAVDDPLLFEAAARRKQGFSFPMDRWMKEYGDELEEMSQQGHWVDRDEARSLWKQFRAGRFALVASMGADGVGSKELSATRLAPPPAVPPASRSGSPRSGTPADEGIPKAQARRRLGISRVALLPGMAQRKGAL